MDNYSDSGRSRGTLAAPAAAGRQGGSGGGGVMTAAAAGCKGKQSSASVGWFILCFFNFFVEQFFDLIHDTF